MLDLQEAIQILESGEWLALRFITADIVKGTGGKVIELAKCRISRFRGGHTLASKGSGITNKRKDANHALHFTRNVELPNKQLRKVHPILITHINHQPVI